MIAAAGRWARDGGTLLRVLLAALCLLTLVVCASALKRLGLYEEAYGFTRLRFAAHAILLWLGALFVLVLVARGAQWLPRAALTVTLASFLAFALADPDRRIAEWNVDRYERTGKIDAPYLGTLSADAVPALRGMRCVPDVPDANGLAGLNVGRAQARAAGIPPKRLSLMRAFYEDFWADAPAGPRALRVGAPARAPARRGAAGRPCAGSRLRRGPLPRAAARTRSGVEIAEAAAEPCAGERARRRRAAAAVRRVAPGRPRRVRPGVVLGDARAHPGRRGDALGEIRRVLRPGGRALITVPYHGRLQAARIALTRFEAHFDPLGQHVRFFTRRSLVERAGVHRASSRRSAVTARCSSPAPCAPRPSAAEAATMRAVTTTSLMLCAACGSRK